MGMSTDNAMGPTARQVESACQGHPLAITGAWGSLQQDRDIQVGYPEWNEAPDYMVGDMTGDEHYVQLTWRAEVTAKPASAVVPITVRQQGAGEVTLRLRVNIASTSRPSGRPHDRRACQPSPRQGCPAHP
jgi:hypothetical protein